MLSLQLKETLEEYIPDIGTLSIWLNGPLSGDRYRKYCLGRSISIRFDSLPGDHPLLVVDDSQLSGTNLQVTVYEVSESNRASVFVCYHNYSNRTVSLYSAIFPLTHNP